MKNKTKILLLTLIIFFINFNFSFSNEIFNFDVTEIEIKEKGNRVLGKDGGKAKSLDGTTITANNFDYDKLKNILIATENVKIYDPKKNVIIYSDEITYFKNNEIIITNGNSKAIDKEVEIDAKNFEYNKLKNTIYAQGDVKINNKKDKYLIYSDEITYNKFKGTILTKSNSKAISDNITIDADIFKYDERNNILIAEGKVKVDDKIEDYKLEAEYLTYNKNFNKIFTEGKTYALIENKYEFKSKNVFLNRNKKELKSNNYSTIKDDEGNFYRLSKFLYFYEKKFLKGNDIEVDTNYKSEKNDKLYFKDAFINFSDNSFIAKDTKINLHKKIFDTERELVDGGKNLFNGENDPRIFGSTSSGNEDIVVLNKGIFTSCKKNDSCPPWSMKANKLTHDRVKQNIIYENAILRIYDVPVFYFPKFFHPDPSVNRRSGLLQPRLNNSNVLGSSINIPYFHVISEDKDITFKPTFFDNRVYMFQNEYRQESEKSSFIADFSYIKGYQSKKSGEKYDNRNSISHIFSKFDLDLGFKNFTNSTVNFFLEKVNNDTYLKTFEDVIVVDKKRLENDLKDKNNLTSGIKLSLDNEKYKFTSGLTVYENLQSKKNDRYQHILPYYEFSKNLFTNNNGTLSFSSNGDNSLRNTNNLRTRVSNTVNYSSIDLITKKGFVNNFGIYFTNFNAMGKKDTKYKSSVQTELININELTTKFPMFKDNKNKTNYFTPKASLRINPSNMKNNSARSRILTTDSIFGINRLGVRDGFESGKSLTLGLDYKIEDKENTEKFFEVKLAGVIKDTKNKKIPTSSTLDRTTSNLFGSIENSFSEFFSLNYDFALDNDFNTFENNSIEAEFSVNNFVTTFNFLERSGEMGDTNSISNTTKINFNKQNSFSFKTRRNRKLSLTEYYDLVYEYQNDCLTAGIKYKKTYYQDRDLRPKEDLFLTITLFPLSSIDQKVEEGVWRGDNAIQNIFD
tara:strand:- start:3254 stop:6148 length:2895 start_codon:yes stop_codon:yes gene_type:complete